ncbi:histidine phosphatase family protein [Salicibibacter halophilus]|uniref:Histidine phosphatase family protein n=1 Tax=Salicibibacter halophilus TaxID=2502791 RepID=A0A514LN03_9BACI|nr:histidine phosphatase family protein [Salicibibacter halophilus]QDI92631.1 histidine phosphatase family protein [Salicibibacter halophilus]
MTTFGLIRHGITDWNENGRAQGITDIPLNVTGKQQASALANRLFLEEKWDMIVASDLSRAMETAEIIADKLKLPISHDARIREMDCGEIEGTTEEERVQKWGSDWRQLNLGIETAEDIAQRGSEFLEESVAVNKNKRVLIVSHGGLISHMSHRLLPDQFPLARLENTSVTNLRKIENNWECTLYNCTKHLGV